MRAEHSIGRDGNLRIELNGHVFVEAIRTAFPDSNESLAECVTTPWEDISGNDALGRYTGCQSTLAREGKDVLVQSLRNYGEILAFRVQLLETIRDAGGQDSFERHSLHAPWMDFAHRLKASLATYGLGSSEDPFAGYWPTVLIRDVADLPSQAFAPLAVFDGDGALAIAPSNHFLTSSLAAISGGVARGLHGSIDPLAVGTQIDTLFAVGEDIPSALMSLGDGLLREGGKHRPTPSSHPLTSTLGWWNAYGGYYTEPIHPLSAYELHDVIDDAKARDVPIRYLGLDLWYPYASIGHGIEFTPDEAKYPDGVGPLARSAGLPTVLHISALARENVYQSDGSDGVVYETIGDEVRRQEGVAVWHDWMRTQQHVSSLLRSSLERADAWYRDMTSALGDRGLEVLQCMQTMGMALASTQAQNARSARTSIDYLFALPEAIETLANLGEEGFRREAVRPVDLNRQNLLMGMFLYSLGLLPFHDLFLTCFHDGIGGSHPKEDAILRALSCGPVGIGDAPGKADVNLLKRLILPDGRLLQPDRPPFPDPRTLGEPIETYWTLHQAGEHAWLYVLLLNLSDQSCAYDIESPLTGSYVVQDGLRDVIVDRMQGELASGGLAYYKLSPMVDGIAPLGLVGKFVSAPAERFVSMNGRTSLQLTLNGVDGTLAFLCEAPIEILADGVPLAEHREGEVSTVRVSADHGTLEIRRR